MIAAGKQAQEHHSNHTTRALKITNCSTHCVGKKVLSVHEIKHHRMLKG